MVVKYQSHKCMILRNSHNSRQETSKFSNNITCYSKMQFSDLVRFFILSETCNFCMDKLRKSHFNAFIWLRNKISCIKIILFHFHSLLTLLCILRNNSYFILNEHNRVKCIYQYLVIYVKTVYLSFQANCIKSYSVSGHKNALLFVSSYSNLYLTLTHIRFTTTCSIFYGKISEL